MAEMWYRGDKLSSILLCWLVGTITELLVSQKQKVQLFPLPCKRYRSLFIIWPFHLKACFQFNQCLGLDDWSFSNSAKTRLLFLKWIVQAYEKCFQNLHYVERHEEHTISHAVQTNYKKTKVPTIWSVNFSLSFVKFLFAHTRSKCIVTFSLCLLKKRGVLVFCS